jgi:hypothetical protein
VRDGIKLARAGTPVVVLVTETFEDQARFVADAEAMPDVPRILVPHPIAGTEDAYMAEIAQRIAPDVITLLHGTP